MKKKLGLAAMVAAALLLSGCQKKAPEQTKEPLKTRTPQEVVNLTGTEFISLAKGSKMELLVSPDTGTIRWQSQATKEHLDTKLFDESITQPVLKSDVVATYFTGRAQDRYSTNASMDTYTYGVEQETMSYEALDNGVRIVYELGSDKVTYKDFPAYIRAERMNELVMQFCDKKQEKAILAQYKLSKSGIYSRVATERFPLTGMAAKQLYELFYVQGSYNYEELEKDNQEFDKLNEMPQRQHIVLVTEYVLDGDDLVVKIPTGEMIWNEEFPIRSLDVLPYFLSTQEKEGYLFVPDGSGALIYLDNNKLSEYQFSSRYYNGDKLINAQTNDSTNVQMTAPIYGMKTKDYAVLGIIEKGAEIATLNAYINGVFNAIPYSRVSLNFMIQEDQTIKASNSLTYTFKKVSEDYYSDDIQIRYCYLEKEKADYVGMAKTYQDYLVKNNKLKKNEAEENAPFFVELLGEADKQEHFLGVPYQGNISLTTFSQAETILTQLKESGIENLKAVYTGFANGGLNQRAIERVKISSELGGKEGFKRLIQNMSKLGIEVFPNVKLQTVSTTKGISKENLSFFINEELAELYTFDLVKNQAVLDAKYKTHFIAPTYLDTYISKFSKSYQELGIKNLASPDFMTFITGNYAKGKNISMTTALTNYRKALEELGNSYQLALSNPIQEAYQYTDYILDLPTQSSGMKVLDAAVPFLQIVLNGYIPYSAPIINNYKLDIQTEFMKAIETKSALKFRLMKEEEKALEGTDYQNIFMASFDTWKENLSVYYKEYNTFYQKVADAQIVNHEIIERNNDYRIVTYSNGVKVYLNYSDEKAVINGIEVPANSYIIG